MPVSASLGVVSTVSTCVGEILLLTSKKCKNKLLKCCELTGKITSSLVTFDVLISLSLNGDSVIDAKEFHKLETLYLQVMADVRNVDRIKAMLGMLGGGENMCDWLFMMGLLPLGYHWIRK